MFFFSFHFGQCNYPIKNMDGIVVRVRRICTMHNEQAHFTLSILYACECMRFSSTIVPRNECIYNRWLQLHLFVYLIYLLKLKFLFSSTLFSCTAWPWKVLFKWFFHFFFTSNTFVWFRFILCAFDMSNTQHEYEHLNGFRALANHGGYNTFGLQNT